ncbi:hypothetical protein Cp1R7AA1_128 [Mesorhizobium phage Cp1R7A-A1]|nr:hypothetical protein Cp1R7AA1_128 [Mesorhizobium phage Cp1R7A-A1]
MTDKQKLTAAISEVLADAEPGDAFLCCVMHQADCPHFLAGHCDCAMIQITDTTTAEEVADLYDRIKN